MGRDGVGEVRKGQWQVEINTTQIDEEVVEEWKGRWDIYIVYILYIYSIYIVVPSSWGYYIYTYIYTYILVPSSC